MDRKRLEKTYVLNPHYRLRHDIHRVVLFSRGGTESECSRNWHTFIHPLQAVMLSFFTYDRPLKENIVQLSDFFCKPETDIERWVEEFIENPHPVYTRFRKGRIYFPKRVLVTREEAGASFRFEQLEANSFLWRRLDLTTRRLYTGPLMLTLMLTNRCITRCRYCYADTHTVVHRPLPASRWLSLIREAASLQVAQVNLMGGEVFLYREWPELLSELVRQEMAPDVLSTKIPPDSRLLEQLEESGYRGVVQVSLDACDDRILQSLVDSPPGYAENMLRGLHLLDESRQPYQVATVVTTANCQPGVLEELFEALRPLKRLRDWRIVPVSHSLGKTYEELARLKPSKEALTALFDRMEQFTRGRSSFPVILGREVTERKFGQTEGGSCRFEGYECSALSTHLFILPDGKATICEQLYWNPRFLIGDASRESLKEIWDSPRAKALCNLSRTDLGQQTPCRDCRLFEECFAYQNRCWSNIIKAYGSDCWDYPDPRCLYAPDMKNPLNYD